MASMMASFAMGATSPKPTIIGTPRARANMATWLVLLPCFKAMAPPLRPVSFEKAGGRQIVAEQNRSGNLKAAGISRKMIQHTVTDVFQVSGAGAEILVVRGLVAGNLGIKCR